MPLQLISAITSLNDQGNKYSFEDLGWFYLPKIKTHFASVVHLLHRSTLFLAVFILIVIWCGLLTRNVLPEYRRI